MPIVISGSSSIVATVGGSSSILAAVGGSLSIVVNADSSSVLSVVGDSSLLTVAIVSGSLLVLPDSSLILLSSLKVAVTGGFLLLTVVGLQGAGVGIPLFKGDFVTAAALRRGVLMGPVLRGRENVPALSFSSSSGVE